MFIKQSYEDDFEHLILDLKDKYPKSLFELNGINEEALDITKFSRNYFIKGNVSDASIDPNANVQIKSVSTYNSEMYKGLSKLNSLYLIWKKARKFWGTKEANKLFEKEIVKDINVQDSYHTYLPYCYNFDVYDIYVQGLPFVSNYPSNPPKHSDVLLQHTIQLLQYGASQLMGATAISNFLVIYSSLLKIDSLDDTYPIPNYLTQKELFERYLKQRIQEFIFLLNQPLRNGGQCVDEKTEVLTPSGFRSYLELKKGDDIYTWKDGNLNIQKVLNVNVFDYNGILHQYRGRDIIQTVTPNHRILYKKYNTKNNFGVKLSEELFNYKTPIDIPISINNNNKDYPISDEIIKLMVIVLTDGHIKGKRIQIYKSVKRYGIEEIENLLCKLNYKFTKKLTISNFKGANCCKENNKEYKIYNYTINSHDSQELLELISYTKKDISNFVFKFSKRQAKLFIHTWKLFDGYKCRLQCDNDIIADKIQHLCFLAGYGSKKYSKFVNKYNKQKTIYVRYYLNKVKSATIKELINYSGKVWCPSTNDGIVIFRKEGKIFISGNSTFSNITIFDSIFLNKLCNKYIVNDEIIDSEFAMYIQKKFLEFFNEFYKKRVTTFPVITIQLKKDKEGKIEDQDFLDFVSNINLDFAFLNIYASEDLDALSACCRLRLQTNTNGLLDEMKHDHLNLIGGSSLKLGSFGVVTINLARLGLLYKDENKFFEVLNEHIVDCIKINHCRLSLIEDKIKQNHLPLYSLGFISLSNQYSTVGINGIYECLYFLGIDILDERGKAFTIKLLEFIDKVVKEQVSKYNYKINVEQIPAENTSVKLAKIDNLLYKQNTFYIYGNQFIPLTVETDIFNRIELQALFEKYFSGGTILHCNIGERIIYKETMKKFIELIVKQGVQYFAVNYFMQECEDNHLTIGEHEFCPRCSKPIKERYTRIVGFNVPISSWHSERKREFWERKKSFIS